MIVHTPPLGAIKMIVMWVANPSYSAHGRDSLAGVA